MENGPIPPKAKMGSYFVMQALNVEVIYHYTNLANIWRQTFESDVVRHRADDVELVASTIVEMVRQEWDESGALKDLKFFKR